MNINDTGAAFWQPLQIISTYIVCMSRDVEDAVPYKLLSTHNLLMADGSYGDAAPAVEGAGK